MNAFQYNIARAAHDRYWDSRHKTQEHEFDALDPQAQRNWLAAADAVVELIREYLSQ